MKKIRVAYILTPITFGGSEKVSLNFLKTVDRDHFDIRPIILTRPWEEEPYFAREIDQLGYSYATVPVALKTGCDPLRVLRVAYLLHLILKEGAFDLVHTHGYFADICGLPMARLLGLPGISTCHGFIANDRKLKVFNLLDMIALRLCKTVIAVSDGIRDDLLRRGIHASRITVIPNAVAPNCVSREMCASRLDKRQALNIAPHEYVVGYIGRLSEEKGVTYLIEAIAKLRDAAVTVKLLIVGDGPERVALEQQMKDSNLEHMVIFAGFQTDIENWLPALDIFTLPSLTEGTPMALLEAMAAGVPIIATAVGGVPKVIRDGCNGLLIPSGDPGAISENIQSLIGNTGLRLCLGKAGLDTIITKYSIDGWCRSIESIYSSSLAALPNY